MAESDNPPIPYRQIAAHMSDLVGLHEPDGAFLWLSPSVERILGYRAADLVGTDPYALLHPDDHEAVRTGTHEPARQGEGNIRIRYRVRHASGKYIWFETLTQPVMDRAGTVVMLHTTSRNVTEQVDLERALAENEALYRTVVRTMAEGVIVLDANAAIEACNPRAREILGLSCDDLLGRNLGDPRWQAVHRDGRPYRVSEFPAMVTLHTGRPCQDVLMGIYHPVRGERRWISINSQPVEPTDADIGCRAAVVVSFDDVTDQLRREAELRLWSVVYERSSEAIVIADGAGLIGEVNDALVKLTGWQRETVVGQHLSRLFAETASAQQLEDVVWPRLEREGMWRGELWVRDQAGEAHPTWTSVSEVRSDDGQRTHFILILSDITERHLQELWLSHRATHDILTGLPNRLLLHDRFEMALKSAERHGQMLGCLYLDLDGFKKVNDRLGHAAGDELLQDVAKRLAEALREVDTIARIGGDEFMVVAEELDTEDGAEIIAGNVIAALSRPFTVRDEAVSVGVSVGISLYPLHGSDEQTLLEAADTAMYRAKRAGGNRYSVFQANP